jgi:hypothetical protein
LLYHHEKIRNRNKDDEDNSHEHWGYRHLHKGKDGSEIGPRMDRHCPLSDEYYLI